MRVDNLTQAVTGRKLDVMKHAAPQKGRGQLLFGVRGNNGDGTMNCRDSFIEFRNCERHFVQFTQQIIEKLDERGHQLALKD